jgi:pimeloyl-ACP methyl ester carboxylesterase
MNRLQGAFATLEAAPPGAPIGTVLLLPGFTGSKEDFGPILPAVAGAGFHAISVDLPGQYESPGPEDPAAYSVDALAAEILALANDIGARGPLHLLGHSFGGLVARAAVIAAPERFNSLTLMSSGPSAIVGPRLAVIEYCEPILDVGGMEAVYAAMLEMAAKDSKYVAAPAQIQDFLRARFMATHPESLRGMGQALKDEPDRVDELAAVLQCPLLVIYGEGDDAWPPATQAEMADRLHAERFVIKDAKHSPAAEAPGPTSLALLDFWMRATVG